MKSNVLHRQEKYGTFLRKPFDTNDVDISSQAAFNNLNPKYDSKIEKDEDFPCISFINDVSTLNHSLAFENNFTDVPEPKNQTTNVGKKKKSSKIFGFLKKFFKKKTKKQKQKPKQKIIAQEICFEESFLSNRPIKQNRRPFYRKKVDFTKDEIFTNQ